MVIESKRSSLPPPNPKRHLDGIAHGNSAKISAAPPPSPVRGWQQMKQTVVKPWLDDATSNTGYTLGSVAAWGNAAALWILETMGLEMSVAVPVVGIPGALGSMWGAFTLTQISPAEAHQLMAVLEKPETAAERDDMVATMAQLANGQFTDADGKTRTFTLGEGVKERFDLVIGQLKALRF